MNRDKYLTELGGYLADLPQEQKNKVLDFYSEYTSRLEAEGEDLTAKLGTPRELADNILDLELNQGARSNYDIPKKKSPLKPFIIALVIVSVVFTFFLGIYIPKKHTMYWDKDSSHLHHTLEKTAIDSFDKVEIDTNATVVFTPSDGYYIAYDLTADTDTPYYIKDGTLYIDDGEHFNISFHLDDDDTWGYVTIYYPEHTFFETVYAELSDGSINLTGADINNLELDLDMGSLSIDNCNINSISADLDMGNATITDCTINDADFDLDMGKLDIAATSIKNRMTADLDMGSADVKLIAEDQNRNYYGFDLSCDLSSIYFNNDNQGKEYHTRGTGIINISCDLGSINVTVD
ncbi:MAG: DUF4097 family beta strand repeat-containing protein [Clostridium sp.]|nr:DUF4097 family beta strand repeat-containing protein [Clostridium sp.]MCM1399059.1 DUF4097 family beta strand repeat-containing protein [Clostridium sp.]MCM1459450.1 DUF4097 family beta strand repeat-containing protein [Bacteroides sp.]